MIVNESYGPYKDSSSEKTTDFDDSPVDAPHVRTREEVEQMNDDYESELRRAKLAERMGGAASADLKPDEE